MTNAVNANYFISLWLDTRRETSKGYPVKLRVFTKIPRVQKLFATKYWLTEKEFESAWDTLRPRREHKDLRIDLQAVIDKAEAVAKQLKVFNFEAFEKALFVKNDDKQNVFHHFDSQIEKLRDNKQFGTAITYELCSKSLKAFILHKTGKEAKQLHFGEANPDWLSDYEKYMIEDKKRSHTTVSMYLRTLRTLFNNAIESKDIERDIYPFGRRKYQVPATKNTKKAISKESLKKLFDAPPLNFEEERAKDLFFLSYLCNGMNIKDIAELRCKDYLGDRLQFIRAKTKHTSKSNMKAVVVLLHPLAKSIIEKYATPNNESENYLMPFLSDSVSSYTNFQRVKNLTRSINKCIKILATSAEIKENISCYTARHSFATNAIRGGASMEYISEALSHSNMKTTQNYFAGFEDKTKKEITESLMKF